ncbi:MAG: cell division protein FtsK [Planctomycetia bacterium]|nr:cell division protein FtsK [Planctomycetia bacterium]
MTEPALIQRQRTVFRELARLSTAKTNAVAAAAAKAKTRKETAQQEAAQQRKQAAERWAVEKSAAEREYQDTTRGLKSRFDAEHPAARAEYQEAREGAVQRFEAGTEKAKKQHEEFHWTSATMFEAGEKTAKAPLEKVQQHVTASLQQVQDARAEAATLLKKWHHRSLIGKQRGASKPNRHHDDAQRNLAACLKDAEVDLRDLRKLVAPKMVNGVSLLILLLALWGALAAVLLVAYPDGLVAGKHHWALVSGGAALLLVIALGSLFYVAARLKVQEISKPLHTALADAELTCQRWLHQATRSYEEKIAELNENKRRRDAEVAQADEKHRKLLAALTQRRDTDLQQAEQKYPPLIAGLEQRHAQGMKQAEDKYRRLLAESKQRHDATLQQADETCRQECQQADAEEQGTRQELERRSQQALLKLREVVTGVARDGGQLFPPWAHPSWQQWSPPRQSPPVLRFGDYQVTLANVAGPLLTGNGPAPMPAQFNLPALLPFPQQCSVLLKAKDEGRAPAVAALQAVMFRFLTALPPGKVRFTIIDPVGLGENFSAFMHLADYDEQLVASRIWTEPQQVEQRLADLAAHMENVIQKYLRNQYATIEEYNAAAGEVAEPFRVLVVANFPVNFTADAARRLVSIAASGASCGVYTLVSVDTRQPLPHGFNLADLEQSCINLVWKDQRFHWKDADFGTFPLRLDALPEEGLFNRLLHQVGAQAKEASRVEVSFDFIAPAREHWWEQSSQKGIDVPLGRAGATKRQHLRLGQGTAQHVLIAGKTGSGKSTLLHALITNLGLLYSPKEVELYLVDFKKGVEFKTYVTHGLPHARVIAVESEREFGLSVLQRLDAELKHRGEVFRGCGAQNLSDYRDAVPDQTLPRILLIVDEFQEFFVEDDKIAQEAGLLLDRLVRQGRAFGLHVLLGSQTLGGAYSLARSTIDQMAVRIALQCSEADANLILSKENSAARLLTRPGEAIYNDANGLVEGNDIFQVVWLPDERREVLLQQVHDLARQRALLPTKPRIVFEGNAPADPVKNRQLQQVLEQPVPSGVRAASAWLGESIAIKEPTAAVFRRQASSNLLLIGQQEEGTLGILTTALIGLAAQMPGGTEGTRFFIIDSVQPDSPFAGAWSKSAAALPSGVQVAGWRELAATLGEIAAEVERRQKANDVEAAPVYVFVHGLQRFKELRRQEDDFSFSRRGEERIVPPAQLLGTILRDGPVVGVHTLAWCDSLNNLQRCFDRQGMRDFEMRVLFQMNANDSSTLIDTPAASRLGVHRALFSSEDLGAIEKFRPYGLPTDAWLQAVRTALERKLAACVS